MRTKRAASSSPRTRFRDVLRVREFAVVFGAEMQSVAGDQLARVALSILVFERTGSAVATSLTYAVTFLPAILGGLWLGRIGDRFSRRAVMVGTDIARAALVAAMALPGLPITGLIALLAVAVFLGPAFSSAEVSFLAGRLSTDQFRVATGLRMTTGQVAQVVGFGLGGLAVTVLTPRGGLLVDAGTYALSALVLAIGISRGGSSRSRARPPRPERAARPRLREVRVALRGSGMSAAVSLIALAGFFVVPEGLAVPFAAATGGSATQVGLLLASIPLGSAVGVVASLRLVAGRHRERVAQWMAVGCGLPLVVPILYPHFMLALACWFASGVLAAYQVEVMTMTVPRVADAIRSTFVGVASAALVGAQGVGLALFGALSYVTGPTWAIGLAGLLGSLCALLIVLGPMRLPGAPRTSPDSMTSSAPAVPTGQPGAPVPKRPPVAAGPRNARPTPTKPGHETPPGRRRGRLDIRTRYSRNGGYPDVYL